MAIDRTQIYTNHKGRWVAVEDDEQTVVGSGDSAREALDQARANGCEEPIVTRMPLELMTFMSLLPRGSYGIPGSWT
jgi:Family of unknown function (DUF5678)